MPLIKQIPNTLTTLRLLLAVPICLYILERNFEAVLWIVLIAGLSDGVDGWLARLLDAQSRYGAIVDPLSDKVMLTGVYICLAMVGLLPWWFALLVVMRDVIIVVGALCYHWLVGRYDMAPSFWGKVSTFVQIAFALMMLIQQVKPWLSEFILNCGMWLVVGFAIISGGHYVVVWGKKALAEAKLPASHGRSG